MINLKKLIDDGIYLADGDVLKCVSNKISDFKVGEEITLINYMWLGKKILENKTILKQAAYWEVVSFAERKNETGECPVPDWCPILFSESGNEWSELGGDVDFNKETTNWYDNDYWKPNMEALVKHYNIGEEAPVEQSEDVSDESDITNKTLTELSPVLLSGAKLLCTTNAGLEKSFTVDEEYYFREGVLLDDVNDCWVEDRLGDSIYCFEDNTCTFTITNYPDKIKRDSDLLGDESDTIGKGTPKNILEGANTILCFTGEGDNIYTEEMYNEGILPEVGMLVWSYWLEEYKELLKITFDKGVECVEVVLHFEQGMKTYLKAIEFPQPEKTFEEKVVDEMIPFWKESIGTDDPDFVLDVYKEFKRIEKGIEG